MTNAKLCNGYFYWWLSLRFGEVIITTTQLHLTKPELTFCGGSTCDGENF